MQVAHDWDRPDDGLALQLHHHAEDAVGARVLRSQVQGEQIFILDDAQGVEGFEDGVAELCALPGHETLG